MRVFLSSILSLTLMVVLAPAAEVKLVTKRSETPVARTTLSKRTTEDRVFELVPHLAASSGWKSQLLIRNDSPSQITLAMDFFGETGIDFLNRVEVDMVTSDGDFLTGGALDVTLSPYEIFTLEFRDIYDTVSQTFLVNFQIFVSSSPEESGYSLEPQFYRFINGEKVAAVGVAVQDPGDKFFMNLDRRLDLDTGLQRIRGLAITNFQVGDNTCSIAIFDQFGSIEPVAEAELILSGSAKSVRRIDQIFPDIDQLLPNGLGLFDCRCSGLVGALGLVFEPPGPIVGSVPIDYFEVSTKNPGKRIVRQR